MKKYIVGGAVRDKLLGREPKDIDYVVVDATVEQMVEMGFTRQGKGYPVFVNGDGCEYALARNEKRVRGSTGRGEYEFSTEGVTIKEDLSRRDLTINAIAVQDFNFGAVKQHTLSACIDPFGGVGDLKNKVLRHVSPAFKEDPLRVFRVARFASVLPDFTVAPETLAIMREVTQSEEFREVKSQRVYQEMALALKTSSPSKFFYILKEVGGLDFFFPEIANLIDVPQSPEYHPEGCAFTHTMLVLDSSTQTKSTLRDEIVFSALVHDLGKGVTPKEILPKHIGHDTAGLPLINDFCKRLGVPNRLRDMALMVCEFHIRFYMVEENGTAKGLVRILTEMKAYKDRDRLEVLVQMGIADGLGKLRSRNNHKSRLELAYEETCKISFSDILPAFNGSAIGQAIREHRVKHLKARIKEGVLG